MTPKLNQELQEALSQSHGELVEVEDHRDHTIYVLVPREQYRKLHASATDPEKLREAIIARRDESRVLNDEWEHVDRQVWQTPSNQQ